VKKFNAAKTEKKENLKKSNGKWYE